MYVCEHDTSLLKFVLNLIFILAIFKRFMITTRHIVVGAVLAYGARGHEFKPQIKRKIKKILRSLASQQISGGK